MTRQRNARNIVVSSAMLLATSSLFAQGLITVYQNDFETPNAAQYAAEICKDGGGTPAGSNNYGTFSQNYSDPANGFSFVQVKTADRLCTKAVNNPTANASHSPAWQGTGYADDSRPLNRFTGGIVRQSGDYRHREAAGLVFPTQGQQFMDLSMDWSGLAVQLDGANPANPGDFYNKLWINRPNKDYSVKFRFYRLEAGDSFVLVDNAAAESSVNINAVPASPVRTEVFSFSSASPDGLSFDWHAMHYALDMANMGFNSSTQRLGVVWELETDQSYAAFDNILVTASQVPAAEVVKGVDDEHSLPNISDAFAIPDVTANDYVEGGGSAINKASVQLLSAPQYGALSIPDPSHPELILYTPDGVYFGDVTFQYRVCDTSTPTPACTTDPVTVTLHIPAKVTPPEPAAPTPVPGLAGWGIGLLSMLTLGLAGFFSRKRHTA